MFGDVNVMIVLDTQITGEYKVLYYCNVDYLLVLLSIEGIISMILMLVLRSCTSLHRKEMFQLRCFSHNTHRLQLFLRFEKFRVIVFGGDGSIGWVLSAVDKYNLHSRVCV